ncbi:hypothetical protein [Actinomadura litoris]|uniref:hypothetical protein n=1 Tax=Actinomadura litoris TaxID=2678616 RepID=UPI001FA6E417|nr:hypothetical protein [Actinomadura litoris]
MNATAPKTFKATATRPLPGALIAAGVCVAALATAVGVLAAQGPPVIVVLALFLSAATLWPAISLFKTVRAFPKLHVDAGGMTVSAQSHEWRILWEHATQVAVVPMHGLSNHGWLVVWPREGIAKPAPRPHFPEWRPELSAIKFCDLDLLGDSRPEAIETIKKAAGPLWTDTPPRVEQRP